MQVVLEGESLLNDATSITLFLVFLKEVQDLQSQTDPPRVGAHEFGVIVGNIIWLSVGMSLHLISIERSTSQLLLPLPASGCSWSILISAVDANLIAQSLAAKLPSINYL